MDANGDGIGDFAGLMRRLDYLHGLGVTAIWLMPFQTSPGRDDGYDVSDYYGVESGIRDARGLRRVHARRQAARHPGDHRPGRQPHLRPAPVVSGRAPGPQLPLPRLVRLVSHATAQCEPGHGVSRRAEVDLDVRSGSAKLVLPPLLRFPARSEHLQSARPGRDSQDHGVLDPARRLRLPDGRGAVRDLDERAAGAASRSSNTRCCARYATFCSGGIGDSIILAEANVLARDRHGVLRRGRRPDAHDVQLPGQPEPVLRAGRGRLLGRSRAR